MRFTGESEPLARAAAFAARHAAGGSTPIPALTGLRISADADGVRLLGYDYEAGSTVTVPLPVHEPGDVLLPGRTFADVLQALPPGPVEIRTEAAGVRITAGEIEFGLPVLPMDDYPELPSAAEPIGEVTAGEFATMAARMARVALREDVMPILSGTLLEFEPDRIRLSASDRFRIVLAELPWRTAAEDLPDRIVVPARQLTETTKGLTETAKTTAQGAASDTEAAGLAIGVRTGSEALLSLSSGHTVTTMRLIDGNYPSLLGKVPTDFIGSLTVEADSLRVALRRVCIVADRYAAVVLSIGKDTLVVGAAGDVEFRAQERIACTSSGEETTTAFNATYLLDGLDAIGTPYACLEYNAGIKPALLTGLTSPDVATPEHATSAAAIPAAPNAVPAVRYVVMPRRLPT